MGLKTELAELEKLYEKLKAIEAESSSWEVRQSFKADQTRIWRNFQDVLWEVYERIQVIKKRLPRPAR